MTSAEQLAHDQWVGALVMQVLVGVVIPLAVFAAMCAAFWFLLARAQADPNFDIAEIFREEGGKVSMTQILKGGAFLLSGLATVIIIVTIPNSATEALITFSGTWGPTAVALEFVKRKWPTDGKVP